MSAEEYARGPKMQSLVEDMIRFLIEKGPRTDEEAYQEVTSWLVRRRQMDCNAEEAPQMPKGSTTSSESAGGQNMAMVQGTHEVHTPSRKPPRMGFSKGSLSPPRSPVAGMAHLPAFSVERYEANLPNDEAPESPSNFNFNNMGTSILGKKQYSMEALPAILLPSTAYVSICSPPYPLRVPDTSLSRWDPSLVQDIKTEGAAGPLGPRFKATRTVDGTLMSVKVLKKPYDLESQPYFLHEMYAAILCSRHESIVHHYDCWMDDDDACTIKYSQEYLEDPVTGAQYFSTPRPEKEYVAVLYQMLLGIEHLHFQGIVHANITASNVFVVENESSPGNIRIKIGDYLIPQKYFNPQSWRDYQKRLQDLACDAFSYDVGMVAGVMLSFLNAHPDVPQTADITSLREACSFAQPNSVFLTKLLTLTAKMLFSGSKVPTGEAIPPMIAIPNGTPNGTVLPMITVREDGLIDSYNTPAEEIFGISAKDVISKKTLMDLTKKNVGNSRSIQVINIQRNNTETVTVEMKLVSAQTAVFRDISLSVSLRQFHLLRQERAAIADYIAIPIVSINEKSIITEYNRRAGDLFGHTSGMAMGQNVSMLMTPDIAAHHHTFVKKCNGKSAFENSNVIDITRDVMAKHRDGSVFCTKIHVRSLNAASPTSPNGGVLASPRGGGAYSAYFLGAPLTTSVANRNVLSQSTAQLIRTLKAVCPNFGFCVMNDLGTVLEFTETCKSLLGWSSYEVIGGPVTTIMPDAQARHHQAYVDRLCRKVWTPSRVMGSKRTVHAKHRDGHTVAVNLFVTDLGPSKSVGQSESRLFLGVFSQAEGEPAPFEGMSSPLPSPMSQRFNRFSETI